MSYFYFQTFFKVVLLLQQVFIAQQAVKIKVAGEWDEENLAQQKINDAKPFLEKHF